jgi:hypothetical protein
MSMAEPWSNFAALSAWQSECDWCSKQDKSHAEAETGVKTMKSDKVAAKELMTQRII